MPALRPDAKVFEEFAAGSGRQSVSTTMVFARLLRNLVRDPTVGSLVAPIVSDEARTFGLEPLIAEAKIYAPDGQNYVPVDADLPLNYAESSSGQVLQEGITEAGALATFVALSTAYATWGQPMLPVYLFYSMFGFQRVGDLAWMLGDMRGRGILAGCTAGRTTLMGEGLQHDDGQSPLLASTNPAALVYDASFAYEVAVIIEAAAAEMLGADPKDRFWYLTLYNETYPMPALPEGAEGAAIRRGIIDGAYRFAGSARAPGRPAGVPVLLRSDVERRARGPARAGGALRRGRRHVGRDVVDQPAHRRARGGAVEPAPSRSRTAHPLRHRRARRRNRSGGRHHRLHAGRARPGVALRGGAPTRRSGPTGSDAPMPGTPCVRTSKWTPPTSSSRCSSSWRSVGGSAPPPSPGPSPTSASTLPEPLPSASPDPMRAPNTYTCPAGRSPGPLSENSQRIG